MKINTRSLHFSADQKLKDYIVKKLSKLSQFSSQIIDADVRLKLENAGQVRDKIVEVKLNVPGSVLFVKEKDKSFEAAVDFAVESLRRQVIKYKQIVRGAR